jgi:hypothetical protein
MFSEGRSEEKSAIVVYLCPLSGPDGRHKYRVNRIKNQPGRGKFRPLNPEKYRGDPKGIVYRSWLEFRYMRKFDGSKDVKWWASEELAIPYVSPVDGKTHRYFVDFVYCVEQNGKERVVMLEIKPKSQTGKPKISVSKNGRQNRKKFINETVTYAVNSAKWSAARQFCQKHGWEFKVATEQEMGGW